ncbi:lytic transglycosylase domain-containing protein [Vibrio splendidus]|uniref:Lytic transglycosylase domain-containing protein n=1 Tax=Vibrio splendidus TaxID=29497 RepID=A0AA43K495_VIBSP|nr:lytic transglycosylase domain-containing protein [Vibrio splendidus]CAK2097621.1 Twitching motility protein PilT [Vibrio crassostreae]MDH5923911.1 lytic transglycosylase domain-containing protein [Vibrio splendidus]MDH5939416.1 lytic transglycosylase domain-containing protein [Vibrio splendidus]CAK2123693.1 Twitching motility protein PilT [Vibrio crassostreae]CAK2257318.1 Twitching motility protein PilT [Vibrio crassostreae]
MKIKTIFVFLIPFQASAFCFDEAGYHYNVSPNLLRAIARVESNLNPNAINENKNNRGEVVSRDYGLMQINSSWFKKLSDFNVNDQNIYEPCFNVSLGVWVLSSNFSSHGYNWNSIGAYNAGFSKRTETARKIYIQKVQSVYYSEKVK